jgi:hypothetical protein
MSPSTVSRRRHDPYLVSAVSGRRFRWLGDVRLRWSACRLNDQQQDKLKAWITETGATGAWVEKELGIESRSGMVALLHRLGMEHRKPKRCPASWTPTSRPPLSSSTKTYRTRLAIMKPCCSAMRCIRRMRCGRWDAGHLRICRSERPRAAAASGETGQTRMIGAATERAQHDHVAARDRGDISGQATDPSVGGQYPLPPRPAGAGLAGGRDA